MIFSHLPKSAFWSQFLLGIIAILALPAQQESVNENNSMTQAQLELRLSELSLSIQQSEQSNPYFLQLEQPILLVELAIQVVDFSDFSVNLLHQQGYRLPPIRAPSA